MTRAIRFTACLAIVNLVCCTKARGQHLWREPQKLSGDLKSAEPIAQLPKHIPAKAGQLTLFADYTDVQDNSVMLYLINLTKHRIGFEAEDNDPYVKLDALSESGEWERAQAHTYSWCGNSYFHSPSLAPGEFFRFLGYFPADGESRTVRYRVYEDTAYLFTDVKQEGATYRWKEKPAEIPLNLVSNAGLGRVRASDIEQAGRDKMAVRFGSFEAIRKMALGLAEPARGARWGRPEAIKALQRFPEERSAVVLVSLLEDPDERIQEAAIRSLGIIGLQCPAAEAHFQDLLLDHDPARRAVAIWTLADRPMTLKVIDNLKPLLEHPETRIRAAAGFALARACKEFAEARILLLDHADDPDPDVRSFLANQLTSEYGLCPPPKTRPADRP